MAGILEQRDQDVFQQIFEEHWEHFKKHRPYFDCAQYNDAVAKMLGCGRESGGYSEYQCFYCGHGPAGFVSVVKGPSVYRVQGAIRRMWFMW